ncbi:MAG: isoprenylcysteine carboxylmethyltransferase family protein [Sandaracinaceae bacterium]|nr:isoprenylcysteine carboxylmethyltransferase family protein [Sandaracinaceae bacterium]
MQARIAAFSWLAYVVVTFVARTLVQLRTTGRSGVVIRTEASWVERAAGVVFVLAFALGAVGPFVGSPLGRGSTSLLGLALVALGTFATFAAQLVMAGSWRVGVDPSERTELVTRGPFRLVRNPIFTFMMIASLGIALVCPTPLALTAPALLALAVQVQVRLVEEPYLQRTHGQRYRAYARVTGRFVPWLGRLDDA